MLPRDLLPWVARAVRTAVPDAPEDMLLHDIALAAAGFIADAKLLTDTIVIDLQQGVQDYLLDECPSGEHRVWHSIHSIRIGHTRRDFLMPFPGVRTGCTVGDNTLYWDRETHTVTLDRAPAQDTAQGLELAMTVTLNGAPEAEIPEFIRTDDDMREAIIARAVARVLRDLQPTAADRAERRASALLATVVARRMRGGAESADMRMTARGFIAR